MNTINDIAGPSRGLFDNQSQVSLNREALMSLPNESQTDKKLRDYAESLRSGVEYAQRRRLERMNGDGHSGYGDNESRNRFPQIPRSKAGSHHSIVDDLLSKHTRSRKSIGSIAHSHYSEMK